MKPIFLIILAALAALSPAAHAKLEFEQTTVSLDAALFDEESEATYRFINVGDAEIEITRVSASCGCTVPALAKRIYAPGESGEITATFRFGQRVGHQVNSITVQTNSPQNPVYRLQMQTEIPEWAVRSPALLRWTTGSEPQPQQFIIDNIHAQVEVESVPEETAHFRITKVEESAGRMVFEVTPKDTTQRSTEPIVIPLLAHPENGSPQRKLMRLHCMVR